MSSKLSKSVQNMQGTFKAYKILDFCVSYVVILINVANENMPLVMIMKILYKLLVLRFKGDFWKILSFFSNDKERLGYYFSFIL